VSESSVSAAARPSRIQPGEALSAALAAMGSSVAALAHAIDVPQEVLAEVIRGQRRITSALALRLATFFGTSAKHWLDLQEASKPSSPSPEP